MDGWITIGTELSTDKFDKQIANLEKKMAKEEKKKITVETQLTAQEQELERQIEKVNDLADAYQRVNELQNLRSQNKATYSQLGELQQLRETYGTLEQIDNSFSKALDKQDAMELKVAKTRDRYNELDKSVTDYKTKIEGIKLEKHQADIDRVKEGFKGVSSSIQDAVKRAGRLALGIFGIRSAYMALRRASSDLASYDTQYATNLEYIRYVLTQAIAPVLQWIVGMAMRILQLIGMITTALFGVNIFSRGSAENFNKMKAGASGVSKAVKEIKKELVGFDEINRLTDQSDTGTAGGAGGVGMPDIDVTKYKDVPEWMQKIVNLVEKLKKYWKELVIIVGAFAAAILALKLTNFITSLLKLQGVTTAVKAGIALMAAGIVLLAGSVANLIVNWDKMTTKEKVITAMLAVVGAAFITLGYAIATGISVATLGIGAIIAAIVALVGVVIGLVAKLATEEKAIKNVTKAQEDLTKAKEKAKKAEEEYIDAVDNADRTLRELKEAQDKTGLSGEELNKKVEQGILDYKDMTEQQKEVYKAYIANDKAQKDLKTSTENLEKAKNDETIATWEEKMATDAQAGAFKDGSKKADEFKNSVVQAWKDGKLSTQQAQELISKSMTEMSKDGQQTFTKDLPNDIQEGLNPSKYQTAWQRFKSDWKNNLSKLDTVINLTAKINPVTIGTTLGNIVRKQIFGYAKGGIVKLASGGIVNQPGRGVPLLNAVAGERGAERNNSINR